MNAPRYVVPTMKQIAETPWNGRSVVSTFAGCGGSSLGYRIAGFRVLWANEFIEAAREVYALNQSSATILDGRDIRIVDPADVLATLSLKRGQLDVLDGSPPCASFSMSGKRSEGWGESSTYSDTKQRTDDLFYEFVRLLDGLRPKMFVAENVSGLVRGVAKGYFLEILARMKATGYRVSARTLNAKWLGVPQSRARVIFIGVRDDLGVSPTHPQPMKTRFTLADAIGDLKTMTSDGVKGHNHFDIPDDHGPNIEQFAIMKQWSELAPGECHRKRINFTRAAFRRSCPTIVAVYGNVGAAAVCHPTEPRKFSVQELKRICSSPDDFAMTGSYIQRCERLGRAVPPLMMASIARAVADTLRSMR